MRKEMRKKVKA